MGMALRGLQRRRRWVYMSSKARFLSIHASDFVSWWNTRGSCGLPAADILLRVVCCAVVVACLSVCHSVSHSVSEPQWCVGSCRYILYSFGFSFFCWWSINTESPTRVELLIISYPSIKIHSTLPLCPWSYIKLNRHNPCGQGDPSGTAETLGWWPPHPQTPTRMKL